MYERERSSITSGAFQAALKSNGKPTPGAMRTRRFSPSSKRKSTKESLVMFICRSGVRSHAAAEAAVSAGYTQAYNVLEGFQGDKDPERHRDTIGGWRVAGLPWYQGLSVGQL
jgi:rhodanese-related sulfurtransferase